MQWDLVLFPTSDVKGVSTMLLAHIKYRITHMLCPTLYAAVTNKTELLETLFCILKKKPYRCLSGKIF